MANRERGEVSIEVNGVMYIGRPGFDAVCELEDEAGVSFDQVLERVRQGYMSGVRAVTWVLLHEHHGKEIKKLKDASEWIEKAGGLGVVLPWINDVIQLNADIAEAAANSNGHPPNAQVKSGGTGETPSSVLVNSA